MGILFGLCLVLGMLCLLYYGIITVYAGLGTAFAWFWLCAGLGLIILGLIINYMTKHEIRLPNLLKFLIIAASSVGLCLFLIIEGTIIYYSAKKAEPGADYMIVLGAQVRGTTITKSLKKRLDTAAEYLKDNPETVTIVSGGQGTGEDITEAEAMLRYLISKGIEPARIMKEDRSTNTNENILFSRKLMKDSSSSVIIVTNGFHIFRSLSIAKKQGMSDIQGLAAPSDRILTPKQPSPPIRRAFRSIPTDRFDTGGVRRTSPFGKTASKPSTCSPMEP
jgi:uncharacterized SAM-binding protein YcdF (DUF218 family)